MNHLPDGEMQERQFQIGQAVSSSEFSEVYRLRHPWVGGAQWNLSSNPGQEFFDVLDNGAGVLLTARQNNGAIIGSVRLSFRSEQAFILDELYAWNKLAERTDITMPNLLKTTGLIDRLVVREDFRRKGVAAALLASAEQEGRKRKLWALVAAVHEGNGGSEALFMQAGFSNYSTCHEPEKFCGDFLFKNLGNADSPKIADTHLRNAVLGSWELVSYERHFLDGTGRVVAEPVDGCFSGLLIYTPFQYFSVQIHNEGRSAPDQGIWNWISLNHVAYFGTYEVDVAGCLMHHVSGSLKVEWRGKTLLRYCTVTDSTLVLRTPAKMGGDDQTYFQVTWRRL